MNNSEYYPLNDQEKDLILYSLDLIRGKLKILTEKFYSYLMHQTSSISALFEKTDMQTQKKMFHTSIGVIISSVEFPYLLHEQINEVALRHKKYGVKRDHFTYFKIAFSKALNDVFDDESEKEILDSWTKIVSFVSKNFEEILD